MDNKKLPIVIVVVVVAVAALLWSMKSSLGGSGDKAPTGPPREAMQQYMNEAEKGGQKH